ncbi:DUF2269 domain-containing protein [Terrabacter terrigena]|uniref:DUF2269 domain-containing protein n=1 Tax=Terrabacter terrigena TaxID=574718 RepID=A0ABW3N0Z4_9MICO
MTFSPPLRRFLRTVHVAVSVGWLGAIGAYIALNVPAVVSTDPQTVRAAYLMMEPVALYGIVPLSLATLLTGVIQSLGTPWGLFRHYWVVVSLVVTTFATVVLILHLGTVRELAELARDPNVDMRNAGGDLFHSIGGFIALLIPLWLNMYKPRGLTRHGWRRQQRDKRTAGPSLVDADRD